MAFTYFFRDYTVLERAVETCIPPSLGYQNIYVWDAGCAAGQETYSLAMLCAEYMGYFAFKNLIIDATDIDASDLFSGAIREGAYPYDQIQRIPDRFIRRYFSPAVRDGWYVIDRKIRGCVRFYKHDLLTQEPLRTNYSMIVCKNVLLHFSIFDRKRVLQSYHHALRSGGFLVMERTQKVPDECSGLFENVSPGVPVYRRRV